MSKLLSERIQAMLADLKIEQTELSRLAGVTKGAVNQWISGETKSIDARYAFALQRKTGYSAEWILFGNGPQKLPGNYTHDDKLRRLLEVAEPLSDYGKEAMIKMGIALQRSDEGEGGSDAPDNNRRRASA